MTAMQGHRLDVLKLMPGYCLADVSAAAAWACECPRTEAIRLQVLAFMAPRRVDLEQIKRMAEWVANG